MNRKRSSQEIGRTNQRVGKSGENVANSVMHGLGIECLEKIATPVKLTPYKSRGKIVPRVYYVVWGEKVSGDRHGVLSNGTGVLAEVKTIHDRNLRYGDLEDHQHAGLAKWSSHNALAVIVWVHSPDVFIMRYPIEGFVKGTGIDPEQARRLNRDALAWIEERLK